MIWVVPLLAALASAAVLRLAVRSSAPEAAPLALCLAAIWLLANAAWYYDAMWALPVVDWYVGCVALWHHAHGQKGWVALFVHAVAVRLILHVLEAFTGHQFHISYIHGLNATYAWMLALVAYGGHNGSIPDRFRDLLRRLRRLGSSTAHSFREMTDGR